MNKPQSLRNALNKAVPYVADNPDRLHLFVDNGAVVATSATSISWEYRYTLNVVVTDFTGDQNLLMRPFYSGSGSTSRTRCRMPPSASGFSPLRRTFSAMIAATSA